MKLSVYVYMSIFFKPELTGKKKKSSSGIFSRMLTPVIESPNSHARTIPEQKKEALGSLRSMGFTGAYVRHAHSIDKEQGQTYLIQPTISSTETLQAREILPP